MVRAAAPEPECPPGRGRTAGIAEGLSRPRTAPSRLDLKLPVHERLLTWTRRLAEGACAWPATILAITAASVRGSAVPTPYRRKRPLRGGFRHGGHHLAPSGWRCVSDDL